MIQDHLRYEPDTGLFYWTQPRNGRVLDRPVGSSRDGYTYINYDYNTYAAHRVAHLLMTGEWPAAGLVTDHINRDKSDNRWSNLRWVTQKDNTHNRTRSRRNKSGHTGIGWTKGAWVVQIGLRGTTHYVGRFKTLSEALKARKQAEETLW